MFEFIRKNNKLLTGLLMLLVIPSFILGGLELYQRAVGPGNGVAVVDGKAITQKDWDAVHRERVQQLRASQPGMDDSLLESDFAKYQTLERMVNDYMLAAWVHKHQLYVPDQRVQEALLQIPQVAALRETAMLFGVLLAWIFLGEPLHWRTLVGGALILVGVALAAS